MKKLILLFIFISGYCLHAQDNSIPGNTIYELDLSKPAIENTKGLKVKSKKQLVFKLTNANPFKYRYVLKHEYVNIFKDETFINFEDYVKAKPIDQPSEEKENPTDTLKNIATKNIKEIIDYYGPLKTYEAKTKLEIKLDSTLTFNDSLKVASQLILTEQKKLLNDLETFLKIQRNLDVIEQDLFYEKRDEFSATFKAIEDRQQLFVEALSTTIIDDDFAEFFNKNVNTYTENTEKIVELLNKMFSANFTHFTLPIDIHGKNVDFVNITLERHTIGSETEPEVYHYRFWITGGVKIDISAGMFISSVFDNEYTAIDDTDNPGQKRIIENDNGSYDFGFGTMVNLKLRNYGTIAPMVSFGVMLTANQKFQVLAGPGIAIGRDERIIISGGISMGRVNRLSNTLELNTPVDLGTNDIPTNQRFEIGHFIGITYNLSKSKKKN